GASLFAACSLLTQLLLAKDVPLPFLLTGLTLVLGVTVDLGPFPFLFPTSGPPGGTPLLMSVFFLKKKKKKPTIYYFNFFCIGDQSILK
ncbi:hypothetical protein J4536_22890, partial [Escherichia coli]|nr:hypothetical protein [Escherichia coli]